MISSTRIDVSGVGEGDDEEEEKDDEEEEEEGGSRTAVAVEAVIAFEVIVHTARESGLPRRQPTAPVDGSENRYHNEEVVEEDEEEEAEEKDVEEGEVEGERAK